MQKPTLTGNCFHQMHQFILHHKCWPLNLQTGHCECIALPSAGEPRIPDLVLCDLRVPGGAAGLRDAHACRRRPPHPPRRRRRLPPVHTMEEETRDSRNDAA